MQLNLTPHSQNNFDFSAALPAGYTGPILRGSNILTATDPQIGRIVQQELSNRAYAIRLHMFDFLKPFRLHAFQTGSRLVSILALKNNLHYKIEGLGTLQLKQGQFALLHTNSRPATAEFNKLKPHECVEISWSDEWLKPLINKFEFLQRVFVPSSKAFFLQPHPRPAGAMALDIVHDILQTPFDAETSRLLFESKAKEYLILLLIEAAKKATPLMPLTDRERDLLIAIGEKLRTTYDKKFSIGELSRQAGMSPTKLKGAFREIHGNPVGQVSMTARMHEARRLLTEGELTTKQVAEKVSYKLTTSFIKQFHKFFGYWPSDIQRRG